MASLMPNGKQQYFNPSTGTPLAGGLLYTYVGGTSTPKDTWQDSAATIKNTNPVVLDAAGSAVVFWSGNYKIVLCDPLGNVIYTVDNYSTDSREHPVQVEMQTATAGQTVFTLAQTTYTPGINSLHVYVDGLRMFMPDYAETSGTVVTFASPLAAGQAVMFECGSAANSQSALDASIVPYTPGGGGATTNVAAALNGKPDSSALAASGGSVLVGNGGETVADSLNALQLTDYAALRAYAGTRKSVYVTGYLATSAPSGIAGMFVRDDNDTTTADDGGMVIVTSGGKRYKRQSDYVTPEFYLAKGDGTTDDTAAFAALATAIRTVGSGRISFGPGKTYKVFPTGGNPTDILLDFSNCKGVAIEGNGARILTGSVIAGPTNFPICVNLNASTDIAIRNLRFESSYTTLNYQQGIIWIQASYGSKRIRLENLDFKYGNGGLIVLGAPGNGGVDTDRARDITALNLTFTTIYYPLNFRGAGDNFFGRGLTMRNCGRAYFPYNVRDHDVYIDSQQGGPFSDVLLKVYGQTNWYSRLENIKLHYRSAGRYAGAGAQSADEAMVAMDFQMGGTNPAACTFQNIQISYDVDAVATDTNQSLFVARKYDSSGAADTTGSRGHSLLNLTLSGTGRALSFLTGDAVRLFTRSPDNWTGESIYGVNVDGLIPGSLTGSQNALTVDGNGCAGPWTVRGMVTAGNLVRSNTSGKDIVVEASTFGNFPAFTRVPKDYTASWTADTTAPVLGLGTLQTKYSVRGGWCTVVGKLSLGSTTTTGSGNWHISIPFAHSNSDYAVQGSAKGLVAGSFYNGTCEIQPNASTLELMLGGPTGNYVNASTPATWANGNHVEFTITYPIA